MARNQSQSQRTDRRREPIGSKGEDQSALTRSARRLADETSRSVAGGADDGGGQSALRVKHPCASVSAWFVSPFRRIRFAVARGRRRLRKAAKLGVAVAAVVNEKRNQRLHSLDIRTVHDCPTVARTAQKSRPNEDGEMRRQGVVRGANGFGDHARRDADGLMLDEQPKDCEPGWLSERSERRYRVRLRQALSRTDLCCVAHYREHCFSHQIFLA